MNEDNLLRALEIAKEERDRASQRYRDAYQAAYPVTKIDREKNLGKVFHCDTHEYRKIVALTPTAYIFLVINVSNDDALSIYTTRGRIDLDLKEIRPEEFEKVSNDVVKTLVKLLAVDGRRIGFDTKELEKAE